MITGFSAENKIRLAIVFIGFLVFCSFNGLVHLFDWDEINFAESAREMIVTGDYSTVQINFIPFWEKPPLFIWFQVISMKLFGVNEFAARFPNVICGILTLLALFEMGRQLKGQQFGLFWVMAYGASVFPFLSFKSGIIDPWFNLFIFISLYFAYRYFNQAGEELKGKIHLLLSAASLGLAVLTKGPVAILLYGITIVIYVFISRKFQQLRIADLLLWGLVTLAVGGAYHIYQLMIGNGQLIVDFFKYQLALMKTEGAGHGGSIFYHPGVLLIGVFPSSILALSVLFRKPVREGFGLPVFILFWVVLIIFSLVRTKIVHYSSLCYFPISFFAAIALYRISIDKLILSRFIKIALVVVGCVYAFIPLVLQVVTAKWSQPFLHKLVNDQFALACLNHPVTWSGMEYLLGLVLLLLLGVSLFFDGIQKLTIVYFSTIIFVFLTLVILVPKIEAYSQGVAIRFIEDVKSENPEARINSLGYKSYAPLFYFGKLDRACTFRDENEYLLNDIRMVNTYFIAKITHLSKILEEYPQLEIIKKDGGFVLLRRIY